MSYVVEEHELEARKVPFEFPEDIAKHWIPNEPELSCMMNGGSLTMPYLEPFLIRTIREVGKQVEDPKVKEDIAGFANQETHHYKMHRAFNEHLINQYYPELRELEEEMHRVYAKLSKRSLQVRMAYTAGFEAMTMGVTKWMIGDRVKLFKDADTRVASFVIWHMVEETEHKRVAYDAYEALYPPGIKNYFYRAFGVFHGSLHVMWYSMKGYKRQLVKDGLWSNFKSRLRLAARLWWFVVAVFPYLFRAALPGHDPRQEKDLDWVLEWLQGYADGNLDEIPLLDTHDPEMPVPFKQHSKQQFAGA